LLHEEYTTAPFKDCRETASRLKKHWAVYQKGTSPSAEFLEKAATAVQNAERCRAHHVASKGDGNPSTDVDLLARALNSATRPHYQLKLK
jgi:hypothetical protein